MTDLVLRRGTPEDPRAVVLGVVADLGRAAHQAVPWVATRRSGESGATAGAHSPPVDRAVALEDLDHGSVGPAEGPSPRSGLRAILATSEPRSKISCWNEARATICRTDGVSSNRCPTSGTGPGTRRGSCADILGSR